MPTDSWLAAVSQCAPTASRLRPVWWSIGVSSTCSRRSSRCPTALWGSLWASSSGWKKSRCFRITSTIPPSRFWTAIWNAGRMSWNSAGSSSSRGSACGMTTRIFRTSKPSLTRWTSCTPPGAGWAARRWPPRSPVFSRGRSWGNALPTHMTCNSAPSVSTARPLYRGCWSSSMCGSSWSWMGNRSTTRPFSAIWNWSCAICAAAAVCARRESTGAAGKFLWIEVTAWNIWTKRSSSCGISGKRSCTPRSRPGSWSTISWSNSNRSSCLTGRWRLCSRRSSYPCRRIWSGRSTSRKTGRSWSVPAWTPRWTLPLACFPLRFPGRKPRRRPGRPRTRSKRSIRRSSSMTGKRNRSATARSPGSTTKPMGWTISFTT